MKKIPSYLQVLVAIIIAIIFGSLNPSLAIEMKPLGDLFIKLVKMYIAPIIFSTICLGIINSSSLGRVGKIGFKALIYFEILTNWRGTCHLHKAWKRHTY
jgi:Na+/H+-dicarboxylate symporter